MSEDVTFKQAYDMLKECIGEEQAHDIILMMIVLRKHEILRQRLTK